MTTISRENAVRLLRGTLLCRELSPEAVEVLAGRVRVGRHEAGDVIVHQGRPGDAMLIVASGRVKITTTSAGGVEVLHNLIGPGGVIGEISMLDGQPRSADAVALVATTLLVFSGVLLLETLERYPKAALGMMTVLCEKIRNATTLYEETVFLNLPSRLLRLLQRLARDHGTPVGDSMLIDHGLSQDELAASLGVRRESVNKQLGAWKSSGLIETGRGRIVVRNLKALEVKAERFTF